ncbi:hypothetical protein [Haloarcula sp. 1CSR25-25]|uniref:hypothetical protein n=1 Tax=Haloarcula sp. 1CSR25-25 TaxID=2862545 RepID=UPI0028946054|nr:hypothetical protein [Haloarcula sp. 1CSR25-25]MDT3433262.1 hypothetical protein [Haloarcula sp. 1CSR25-25]
MTTMPVDWDDDVIRRYLTPESHQKSREEFAKTHIDIDKIRADYLFPHPTNDEFVTQEEFRDAILKSNVNDDNRIFILRGETGSGKSQLCQWLEYQIGRGESSGTDETHIALHVSRSQTRIEDIVEILTDPVDLDIQVGNVEDLSPKKVADAMVTNLDAYAPAAFQELTEREVKELIADRTGDDLRSILTRNLKEYQRAVASEDEDEIPDLLDEDDYRTLALSAFGKARGRDTIFPMLRGFLHDELSGKLNVGNFQEKLERISDEYVERGLRPVLICEDLTTFSVLKEQLLDHIFQLDSGHYDVVLGWTTGWEKDDLDTALGTSENTYTYMKDRAEGYLSTTDETGQAYFLTEDATVELARKYVSVIREESAATLDIDIPESEFDDLYPFNAEFIRRSYEHLVQDGNERRTPRLLLIRIVRECLTARTPPFESIEGNPYVKQFPTPVSLDLPGEIQSLAKWYGIPSADGNIQLPRGIPESFEVTIPDSVFENADPVILQGTGSGPKRDFRLTHVEGLVEPGATVTVAASLNSRPEADAEVTLDDDNVGLTGEDGSATVELPNEEREVTITARTADLSDSLSLAVGTDSLTLTPTPSQPDVGDDVTIQAKFNGEAVAGVPLHKDGEEVGITDEEGTVTITASDPPEMTISGEVEGVEEEITVTVKESGGTYPVDVELPGDEVDQQRFEYEQWLKSGEEYDSSETLRSGAVTVLESWYDPTRLANPNASATGVAGIYYARGSETPVSIQSVNERDGLSVNLPFGTEHNPIYEPLLWCGLSADDELPHEERYELNYDLLRGWATEEVSTLRSEMRSTIENCLPDGWTIEEFIIVAQYLLINAGQGTTELSRNLVFEEYSTASSYSHPIGERFSAGHPYRAAYSNLTKSSSVPQDLAEGFFKLKTNFIDDKRLSDAHESVVENLDSYITEAMYIDPAGLPDAYRVGTTRSDATQKLTLLFERVSEYAQELNKLGPEDAEHVVDQVEKIDKWFDDSHDAPQLRDIYERLYESVGKLDVSLMERWETQKKRLDDADELHLLEFKQDIKVLREIESKTGPEFVSLLHKFEESKKRRVEWDIYAAIGEMIEIAEDIEIESSGGGLEREIRNSDEMAAVLDQQSNALDTLGGDNQ